MFVLQAPSPNFKLITKGGILGFTVVLVICFYLYLSWLELQQGYCKYTYTEMISKKWCRPFGWWAWEFCLQDGFGDSWPVDGQSVALISNLIGEYIRELCQGAVSVAELRGTLDNECFLFQI